jgi:hypothetical protein
MRVPLLLPLLVACSAPRGGAPPTEPDCLAEARLGVLAEHLSALRSIHALVGGRASARRAVGFLAVPGAVVSAGALLSTAEACDGGVTEPVCERSVCWSIACLSGEEAGWTVTADLESTRWGGWSVAPATVLLRWAEARPEVLGFTFAAEVGPPDGSAAWSATVHGTLTETEIAVAERIVGMAEGDVGLQWAGDVGEIAVDGVVVARIEGTGIGPADACAP